MDSLIDPPVWFIFLKLKSNSSIFTVANVYGPNQDQGNFLSAVPDRLLFFGGPCFILRGDFNGAFSLTVDTSSGKSSIPHSTLTHIKSLLHSTQLVDVWHVQHPLERDYSCYSVAHNSFSCIDYFSSPYWSSPLPHPWATFSGLITLSFTYVSHTCKGPIGSFPGALMTTC